MILLSLALTHAQDRAALRREGEFLATKIAREYMIIMGENSAFSYSHDASGKPYFIGSKLHVSVSHSQNLLVAAVSDKEIGVDIEKTRSIDHKALSARFFGKEIENKEKFFEEWTAKEAYAKCKNTALSAALKTDINEKKDFNITNLRLFYDYSLSVCGQGNVFILLP